MAKTAPRKQSRNPRKMRGFKKPDSESGFFCIEDRWDAVPAGGGLRGSYCNRWEVVWPDANFSQAYRNVILRKAAGMIELLLPLLGVTGDQDGVFAAPLLDVVNLDYGDAAAGFAAEDGRVS